MPVWDPPPYSPDLASCYFFMVPKVKQPGMIHRKLWTKKQRKPWKCFQKITWNTVLNDGKFEWKCVRIVEVVYRKDESCRGKILNQTSRFFFLDIPRVKKHFVRNSVKRTQWTIEWSKVSSNYVKTLRNTPRRFCVSAATLIDLMGICVYIHWTKRKSSKGGRLYRQETGGLDKNS